MEDEEYKKLSVEDRCLHKLWKARVNGYEEVTKLFKQIDDEKSPEFQKYLGLVKKFVVDSNALGQEKGLEAALAYVENYAHAGKTVSEVMSGVVAKCIAAPKTNTRDLALQLTLMYIEIEKQDFVIEDLIKGMEQKNPKITAACVNACTVALREFGIKVVNPKPLVKKIPALFADRDKTVRDEARKMVVEMYRWMGAALKPQLGQLQPVQVTELEAEFAKIEGQKAAPTRYLRSQQQKQAKMAAKVEESGDAEECDEIDEPVKIDPYDLADPVNILSRLPKDFYEKLEAKKWQERKESLETLETLLKSPKLENGDYGDLVRALKKIVQKDSNVVVVALGGRCIAGLASGLKKRFQPYSGACIGALLEKFKEKKQNVVSAIRDAADAVYLSTNLEAILEDVLEALTNKNPSVKSETCLFLARSFTKTSPSLLNKKLLKTLTGALLKNINEPDPTVRDCAAEALGTLMKLVGEKAVGSFLIELEKDTLKMAKIKEVCNRTVISVPTGGKTERATTAPPKPAAQKGGDAPRSAPGAAAAAKPGLKKIGKGAGPGAAAVKKKEISSGSATIVKRGKPSKQQVKVTEKELSDDEVDSIISDISGANVILELSSANWKSRLSAAEQFLSEIQALDPKSLPCQAIVRTLIKKPGLKDTNFQVFKAKLDIVRYLAENGKFSTTTADFCINDICDKFGDAKNGAAVCETLVAVSEGAGFGHVSACVIEYSLNQKNPKVMQDSLIWLSGSVKEFGFANLNAKLFIENTRKALASNNPGVRQSAITFLGTLYLYMGLALHMFFENEKPALKEQISAEFIKYEGVKPPVPTRGISKSASSDSLDDLDDDDEKASSEVNGVNVMDLLPRVDISGQITEALLAELADKNWKVRNEALTKINAALQEANLIKPNVGELPQGLSQRLSDSNTKIAQTAMNLCESLAKAMGPPCKQHVKVLFPGFLQGLGDSKTWMRTAALDAINAFAEQGGYREFFENEMIGDALKSGSPILRSELWLWLSAVLPKIPSKSIPKEELLILVPHLYSNLEDRNADVRKNAQEAVFGVMVHLGYESMVKQAEKLKPSSKNSIIATLEKVRPNLPIKPLPKKSSVEKEEKVVRGTRPAATKQNVVKSKGSTTGTGKSSTASNRKKDDDADTSPLLVVNNMKHQRTIDESKLKVLRWNFVTPREEFVELLKDQMGSANVNKTLIFNMFHSDFRYHLKAIENLTEDLPGNSQALIANLDLILKWLTLRFFDTNPSVLLKGLEYLHSVFNMLIDSRYHMLENEASSFIPYLILKIGDPKDAVRNGVRSLFRQLTEIYAISRLFTYIMEGVKSKNARQRAECLELMGSIIEDFGINVCLPSPAACLKEVAKQISDRDNSVRNAALNCIVQAYYIVNEKVYKMIGNISDKDMSLLEERIKRAGRKLSAQPPKAETAAVPSPVSSNRSPLRESGGGRNESNNLEPVNNVDEEEVEDLPQLTLPTQLVTVSEPEEIKGPYRLDPEFLKELEGKVVARPTVTLKEFDLDFLQEEIKIPGYYDKQARVMPLSPPKPIAPGDITTRLSFAKSPEIPKMQPIMQRAIPQIGSLDKTVSLIGMEQIQEILRSSGSNQMIDYENEFMSSVTAQLKILHRQDPVLDREVPKLYRRILTVIDLFYSNKILGRQVSQEVLREIMGELIILIVEKKLESCPNGEAYTRIINLHCAKLIERSDHTKIICALIELLQHYISLEQSRPTELVMKCLWRAIKLMPGWGDELDYEEVLVHVHLFLRDYPSEWWRGRDMDTPLRTIKTIVHSSVKIKGPNIKAYLGKCKNRGQSEVEPYISKVLKGFKMEDTNTKQGPVPARTEAPNKTLSRETHNTLTDIFQKIGSKNETKEGLTQLYDFLKQHPEADIEPFLSKASQFFQNYIKNGLQEIETSRKMAKSTSENVEEKVAASITSSVLSAVNVNEATSRGPEYWRQRLNMWNQKWEEIKTGKK